MVFDTVASGMQFHVQAFPLARIWLQRAAEQDRRSARGWLR